MARIALVGVRSFRRRVFRVFAGPAPLDLDVAFRAQAQLPSDRRFRPGKDKKQHQECAERKPGGAMRMRLRSQRPCWISRAELA